MFFFNVRKACKRLGLTDGYSGLMRFDISNTIKTRSMVIRMLNLVMEHGPDDIEEAIGKFNEKFEGKGYSVRVEVSKKGKMKRIVIYAPVNVDCPFLCHRFVFKKV